MYNLRIAYAQPMYNLHITYAQPTYNHRDVFISRSQAYVSRQLEIIADQTAQAVNLQISKSGLQMPNHTNMRSRLHTLGPLLEVMGALNAESLGPIRLKYSSLMQKLLNKVWGEEGRCGERRGGEVWGGEVWGGVGRSKRAVGTYSCLFLVNMTPTHHHHQLHPPPPPPLPCMHIHKHKHKHKQIHSNQGLVCIPLFSRFSHSNWGLVCIPLFSSLSLTLSHTGAGGICTRTGTFGAGQPGQAS